MSIMTGIGASYWDHDWNCSYDVPVYCDGDKLTDIEKRVAEFVIRCMRKGTDLCIKVQDEDGGTEFFAEGQKPLYMDSICNHNDRTEWDQIERELYGDGT